MELRRLVALAVVLAAVAGGQAGEARPQPSAKASRLVAFRSCGELLGYVKAQAAHFVGPYGFGGGPIFSGGPLPSATAATERGSAPVQGVDYSGTNVQEEGVDEPDLVKTDGSTLYAVAGGRLNAVAVGEKRPRLLDSLELEAGFSHELLLQGDRLLVLSRGGYWSEPRPALMARFAPTRPAQTVLTEIDVSNPKALKAVRRLTLDGGYVAARLVAGSVRIVLSAQVPADLRFEQPGGNTPEALAAATERNRAVLTSSRIGSWLPSYKLGGRTRSLVQCRNVSRPPSFSGLGLLTVVTLDLEKGIQPVDSTAVMTDGRIVYASPQSLYVTTERWADRPDPARPEVAPAGAVTAIHKFDISSPTRTQYRGSGSVSGYLLSQWSLSEHRGVLRVVSTETPAWWGAGGESESFLTTLRQQEGGLVQVGRVGGLGKGERVYAVRFAGDTGYVVTFRQIDPLYTVDLSDPARPRVVGELKIEGYSAYLHPIGDDLLLGIGQDADAQGRPLGTQLSLFDVSDLRRPTRLQRAPLGPGWSEAESDHHAFLYWPRTGLVVVPFEQRAVGFSVGRTRGIAELGRIAHGGGEQIRRTLVVRDSVYSVSEGGVASSSLASLADQGWAAFPAASPKPASPPAAGRR